MLTRIFTSEEVKKLLDIREVIDRVEAAFKEKALGRVQMPPKVYLYYNKYNGDLRTMPCYMEGFDISSVKVVNVHKNNPMLHGLPTVMAVIILVDPKTGFPLSIMDGTTITAYRTGAAGAIASKYLANPRPRVLGLIGAGTQARTQILAHLTLFKEISEVRVWDIRREASEKLVKEAVGKYGDIAEFSVCETAKDAVRDADIVITVTPSRKPIVKSSWIVPGTHINAIGADAPGKEELDPEILLKARIFLDDWEQGIHSGEVNMPISKGILKPDDIVGELGEVIIGKKEGRTSKDDITVFSSTGLAIQDAVAAYSVYEKGIKRGVGRDIDLIGAGSKKGI